MGNSKGNSGNSVRLYFWGLQNHWRWYLDAKHVVDVLLDPTSKNSYESIRPAVEKAIVNSEKQFAGLDAILKGDA